MGDNVSIQLPDEHRIENLNHMEEDKKKVLMMLWKEAQSDSAEGKKPCIYTLREKYEKKTEEEAEESQSSAISQEKNWWYRICNRCFEMYALRYIQFFGKTIVKSEDVSIQDLEFDGMGDILKTRTQMKGWYLI